MTNIDLRTEILNGRPSDSRSASAPQVGNISPPSTTPRFLRALVLGHIKLMAELVAPIVMVDGQKAVQERLCGLLQDVSASHPGLLEGVELALGCVLDPDEIAERALRLVGNREAAVCGALGELLSYVEFELKNHPRIEDADRFLDAVEDLRAGIEI